VLSVPDRLGALALRRFAACFQARPGQLALRVNLGELRFVVRVRDHFEFRARITNQILRAMNSATEPRIAAPYPDR